jgi:energy-coupling factor transport system ATP-binding protein
MLVCQSVSFAFPDSGHLLLRDLDFILRPGEWCALLGHNGSGKSSLCRLMSGLYLPPSGRVTIDGLDTAAHHDAPALRRLVQLVTHDPEAQTIGERVAEDVAFGLVNFGYTGPALEERLAWALEVFGIADLRHRSVHALSGGELQLVRLAGAVAVGPRYLILDEAVAMLDSSTRRRALDALKRLQVEAPLGILLTTHDLDDLAWADRVCWLDDGRLVLNAPTPEALEGLLTHPERPFDAPATLAAAHRLRAAGWRVPLAFQPEPLVEALCASSS